MSGAPGLLPAFSAALTQAAVETSADSYPPDYIVSTVLKISGYLIDLEEYSNLFGKPGNDPYSPSLRTLYDRLHTGCLAPSPLPAYITTEERIKASLNERVDDAATARPLADLEDLYYAVLARMQEMLQLLNLRINSGFNTASSPVFDGGPTITDLHHSLSEHWAVLNDAGCGKALDDAIRQATVESWHREVNLQVQKSECTQAEAGELLDQLYDPDHYNNVQGLDFVQDWAPPIVGARLEQKYRVVLRLEKEEADKKAKEERKKARMMKKKVQFSRELAMGPEKHQEHSVRVDAKQVHKSMRIEVEHQDQQQMQTQCSNAHQHQDQGHIQQVLEQERARQDRLHHALEWQMKTQRVSEYSQYLRYKASQDARYAVQNTLYGNHAAGTLTGSVQEGSYGDTHMGHAPF